MQIFPKPNVELKIMQVLNVLMLQVTESTSTSHSTVRQFEKENLVTYFSEFTSRIWLSTPMFSSFALCSVSSNSV